MGWSNPDVPWSELEAVLSGRAGSSLTGGPEADGGDSPAWSRKREPYRPPPSPPRPSGHRASRTPSCTATPTSASSTARAIPRSWSRRPPGWGSTRSRSPTTTACTAWSGSPRPPPSWGSARSSARSCRLGLTAPQNGVADPEGSHLLLLARDPDGYRGLCRTISTAQLAGRRRGARSTTSRRSSPTRPGTCSCSPAAARARCGRRWTAGGRRRRPPRSAAWSSGSAPENVAVELTDRSAAHGHRAQRRPGRARRRRRAAHGRQHGRALRHPGAVPAGHGAGGGAGPAQPGRRRRLAAARGHRAPALGRGDGRPLRRPPPGAVARAAEFGAECAFAIDLVAPDLPPFETPPGRTEAQWLRELTRRGVPGALRQLRRVPRGRRHGGAGAGGHRGQELPRLLPDRARHRGVLPRVGHPLPGPRLGGELRGLLRARHHQRRRGGARPAVRAVPVPGPRRLPGHRPRHRVRPPRGGHPVRLQPLRARPRGAGGERDHLPAAVGGARHGQGAGLLAGPAGRVEQADRAVARGRGPAGQVAAGCPSRSRSWPTSSLGFPRHLGIHSGGMVICDRPVGRGGARWSGPGWRAARSCSGTRTTARRPGWSSSTCSGWACSPRCT